MEDEEENSPIIKYSASSSSTRNENFVARFSDSSMISSFTLSNGKAPVGVVFRLRVRDPLRYGGVLRVFSFYARIFSSFFKVQILTTFSAPEFVSHHFIMAEHLASIFGTEKDRVNCPFYFKVRRHNNTHRFEEKRSLFCFFPIKVVETNRSRIGTQK